MPAASNDTREDVSFPDHTPVTKQPSIKYLGTVFSATLDVGMITRQKITEASQTLRLLMPLWSDNQISTAWKLVVFNAIIRSRILYTLETLELTPSHQRTLDTLYYQGLRKVLHKPATYIDRTWTHDRLLTLANQIARRASRSATPKHQPFSPLLCSATPSPLRPFAKSPRHKHLSTSGTHHRRQRSHSNVSEKESRQTKIHLATRKLTLGLGRTYK